MKDRSQDNSKIFNVDDREGVVIKWGKLQVEHISSRMPGVLFWTVLNLRC